MFAIPLFLSFYHFYTVDFIESCLWICFSWSPADPLLIRTELLHASTSGETEPVFCLYKWTSCNPELKQILPTQITLKPAVYSASDQKDFLLL